MNTLTRPAPAPALTAKEISDRLCEGNGCSVVHLRWEIAGSEFTESVAHYTADSNRRIWKMLAQAIAMTIQP